MFFKIDVFVFYFRVGFGEGRSRMKIVILGFCFSVFTLDRFVGLESFS